MRRRWLRWPAAPSFPLPRKITLILFKLEDVASLLGWRPPIRSTAMWEIACGAVGNEQGMKELRLRSRDLETALMTEPSSVQERWFAKLYFIKPLAILVLSLFWIATGVIALSSGWDQGVALMREGGAGEGAAAVAVAGGAVVDIAIGAAIAFRPSSRYGLLAALALSVGYLVLGTLLLPRLWADPLGPLLKVGPILVSILLALAISEDR